ncbi:MAG: SPFH domain-containing protein [Candidatus Odinarchaeota archaeon]
MASDLILIVMMTAATTMLMLILLVSFLSRYKDFSVNEGVIHMRSGKVMRASAGGSLVLLPLIDEVILIPLHVQQLHISINSRENALSLKALVTWKVTDPRTAFSALSWVPSTRDHVIQTINKLSEKVLGEAIAGKEIADLVKGRKEILDSVKRKIHEVTRNWGIDIVSVGFMEVSETCSKCGVKIYPGDKFCTSCGKIL